MKQLDLFKNPSNLMNGSCANPHGVFCDGTDSIRFQHPKKYWVHLEIEFAQLASGYWIAAKNVHTQNFGMGHGLSIKFCKQYQTKSEALTAACKGLEYYLRAHIGTGDHTAEDKAIVKTMIDWMDSQLSLFGGVA
jgi:hypothetical protein